MERTLADIKRDLRNYLDMLSCFEKIGHKEAVREYRQHVAAVQAELDRRLMLVH